MRLSNGITKNNVFSTFVKYIRVLTQTFSNWCDVHSFRIAFVIFVEPRTSFLSSILNPRKFTLSHRIYISSALLLHLFLKKSYTNREDLGRWVPKMTMQYLSIMSKWKIFHICGTRFHLYWRISVIKLQKDLNNNSPHLGYRLHSK